MHEDSPGLTTYEAEARLETYGFNDVEEKKSGFIKKFFAPLYSPISLMLIVAAALSYFDGKTFDCYFILVLFFVNYGIQKWQEFKADRAIEELQNKIAFEVSTLRDGIWVFVSAKRLVPGDCIRLGLGSMIPADAIILHSKNCSVNEAVLTGESFPVEKKTGDQIYSGAFITAGNLEAEISATGKRTKFGKTIFSIEESKEQSILERDILSISRFLTIISISAVIILTTVLLFKGFVFKDLLTLDISLIIAGIPVALPAIMTIILSIGASGLAQKMVVVRRLSSLQDLANANLLLTDKTGTLTKNEIQVANIVSYDEMLSTDGVMEFARLAASVDTPDAIDRAIIKKFEEMGRHIEHVEILEHIPYDSDRKHSTVYIERSGKKLLISMGAPQIIQGFDDFGSVQVRELFENDIRLAAEQGFRTLAIAVKKGDSEERDMKMTGLLYLADPLDETSKETIRFMHDNGIGVKMLTGDNMVIAERVARELGLHGAVLPASATRRHYNTDGRLFDAIGVFAEILPKDKYEIVKAMKTRYIVAATGDGINDLPALKAAHVSIAVSGAVTALKSMADIVLLGRGLSVIQNAIVESRKIFLRLYHYSVYRISESFRLIITILVLGASYGFYPLQPLQLILLAFLNDIPIITLAFDRVKISPKPSTIKAKERLRLSLLYGLVGVFNSILLFLFMTHILRLSLPVMQTMFFLKLTISGHMLIFVAHTKERWFRFLPSREVVVATIGTQLVATVLALTGYLMSAKLSPVFVLFIWLWALLWMQVSEMMKDVQKWLARMK